jgi:hypothetical protein
MSNSNDELADLCLDHAWRDEIDDDTRWLLEQAAKRINRLGRRCLRLSHRLEELEARMEERWGSHLLSVMAFACLSATVFLCTKSQDVLSAVAEQFARLRGNLAALLR